MGGARTTAFRLPARGWPAGRTLMVEPDSAEPIWKTPRSVSRSGGEPGFVEFGEAARVGVLFADAIAKASHRCPGFD